MEVQGTDASGHHVSKRTFLDTGYVVNGFSWRHLQGCPVPCAYVGVRSLWGKRQKSCSELVGDMRDTQWQLKKGFPGKRTQEMSMEEHPMMPGAENWVLFVHKGVENQ